MNKHSLTSAITLVLVSTIPAMAAPVLVDEQASGLLASPAAPAAKDPQVQQAVEIIKAQHQRSQVQFVKPTSHTHRNMDRALILGGPEVVPM